MTLIDRVTITITGMSALAAALKATITEAVVASVDLELVDIVAMIVATVATMTVI